MGMVVVISLTVSADGVSVTTIRSTLSRTRSAASSRRRSGFPSANRYSMVIFFPSVQPSLRISRRNASTSTELRKPCCYQESYASDFPCLLRVNRAANRKEHGAKGEDDDFLTSCFSLLSPLDTPHSPLFSFNQLVRPSQYIRRDRKADLLGASKLRTASAY